MFFHAAQGFGHVLLILHGVANFVGRFVLAKLIGNVRLMANGSGKMAFHDVRVKIGNFAAADGFDEIGIVTVRPLPFFDFLASRSQAMAVL